MDDPQVSKRDVGGLGALIVSQPGRTQPPDRLMVFLPGFLAAPSMYRQFLTGVAGHDAAVVTPRLYQPRPSVLTGRFTTDDEADRVINFVKRLPPDLHAPELWLAGHSRGGQVAWLAAGRLDRSPGLVGVVVIDPVDGAGRTPKSLHAARDPAVFTSRTMVVGAGISGRCAPVAVNHEHFARNGPPHTTHITLPAMGHGDLLDDRPARVARLLCGGSPNPARERATLALVVREFFDGQSVVGSQRARLGG